ncbi:FecR family protein [Bacteroides zoogleoformans]|uniref:Anti-sigma factor n=1 Tax=Bacteroides zoogleoformans TaxID=28119 RepID=A0ABM6T8W2_9BACE|nr:FecR family protein [Bacteroides zoogleoformans]AVM53065.1 anti-sigma factor [Bacteroides zoogleoformans]TWJ13165.1 FecR family protein [Bacteroides zoogleoformans]
MKNYILQLIELFGHNVYSADTQKEVRQWLADEDHADEKNEALRMLWKQAGEQGIPGGMQQSIRRMQQNTGVVFSVPHKNYQLLLWRAAAILLLAVSSVSIYLILEKNRPEKDLVECYIPTAETHEFTLPDGTRVMLNSRSTLLYPKQFAGATRSVYLIGEANFKVKPDKKHPFIVKANDYQVTALGTEFNVNAYPENNELIATLLEGSVKVEFNNLISNVILKPNEQLIYNKQTKRHNLRLSEIDDVTAWQRGELFFSNMPLEDIFTSLERKFPYAFVYSLHSMNKSTYSFRFRKQANLEEVMKIISQVVGDINYVIKGNKCYVTYKKK